MSLSVLSAISVCLCQFGLLSALERLRSTLDGFVELTSAANFCRLLINGFQAKVYAVALYRKLSV